MKKQYVAPCVGLVGIRLSQGILDLVIDPNEPIMSGGDPAARYQAYVEDDYSDEDDLDISEFHMKSVWDEEEDI